MVWQVSEAMEQCTTQSARRGAMNVTPQASGIGETRRFALSVPRDTLHVDMERVPREAGKDAHAAMDV
jgi:hypothetical protein